jgi:hypothetical protein
MLARQKAVGEHPSLPAGPLDLPPGLVEKLRSLQGVAVDGSVARTSKSQLYRRLSKHLYQMNLPHNVRSYVAGHCVDVSFPGEDLLHPRSLLSPTHPHPPCLPLQPPPRQ